MQFGPIVSESSIVSSNAAPVDVSMYLTSLSQRANYLGQLQGMLKMLTATHHSEEVAHEMLIDHLTSAIESACAANDESQLTDAIMQISAFFVLSKRVYPKLLRELVWAPTSQLY